MPLCLRSWKIFNRLRCVCFFALVDNTCICPTRTRGLSESGEKRRKLENRNGMVLSVECVQIEGDSRVVLTFYSSRSLAGSFIGRDSNQTDDGIEGITSSKTPHCSTPEELAAV